MFHNISFKWKVSLSISIEGISNSSFKYPQLQHFNSIDKCICKNLYRVHGVTFQQKTIKVDTNTPQFFSISWVNDEYKQLDNKKLYYFNNTLTVVSISLVFSKYKTVRKHCRAIWTTTSEMILSNCPGHNAQTFNSCICFYPDFGTPSIM